MVSLSEGLAKQISSGVGAVDMSSQLTVLGCWEKSQTLHAWDAASQRSSCCIMPGMHAGGPGAGAGGAARRAAERAHPGPGVAPAPAAAGEPCPRRQRACRPGQHQSSGSSLSCPLRAKYSEHTHVKCPDTLMWHVKMGGALGPHSRWCPRALLLPCHIGCRVNAGG